MYRIIMSLCVTGLVIALVPSAIAGSPIMAHVHDLPSDEGKILIMLCTREPYEDHGRGCEHGHVSPSDREARYTFEDVEPGEYVIQAIHDENDNNEFDRKWYGKPKEAYGMSRNPKSRFSRPDFEEGAFTHGEEPSSFEILMRGGDR